MKIIKEDGTYNIVEGEKVLLSSSDIKEATNSFLFLLDYPSIKERLIADPVFKRQV